MIIFCLSRELFSVNLLSDYWDKFSVTRMILDPS